MRSSTKLFGGLAVAGLIAVAGSAFTASSTIDQANKFVGAASQSISGVTVSNVAYTTDSSDVTSAVTFHVTQTLTAADTITAKITGTTTGTTPVAGTSSIACTHTVVTGGTDLSCSFPSPLSNVTQLDIAAS
jgi:hypothetical protein